MVSNKDVNGELFPEFIYLGDKFIFESRNENSVFIIDEEAWDQQIFDNENVVPLFKSINDYYFSGNKSERINFLRISCEEINNENQKNLVLILETKNTNGFADQRAAFVRLMNAECDLPVIIKRSYKENNLEDLQLKSASDIGGLFLDGLGDGIWVENYGDIEEQDIINISFGILQAARVRTSKTEYISCPGCGRTLFDLQNVTQEIRERTSHLKNLKIGIMGCIVNGPGEMADADAIGEVGNVKCGDVMKIFLKIEDEYVKDIKFQTFGCGAAIATSSMVTEMAKGKTLDDALQISNKEVAEALDGLPPQKMHCSNLAADALHAAIDNYRHKK